jgi:hypothetical protein
MLFSSQQCPCYLIPWVLQFLVSLVEDMCCEPHKFGMNSFLVITMMSPDLFPLSTNMDFGNRKESHGTKSEEYEYGRQQPCCLWLEIPAQIKQSEQEHYHGGECNLYCPIYHVLATFCHRHCWTSVYKCWVSVSSCRESCPFKWKIACYKLSSVFRSLGTGKNWAKFLIPSFIRVNKQCPKCPSSATKVSPLLNFKFNMYDGVILVVSWLRAGFTVWYIPIPVLHNLKQLETHCSLKCHF